MLTSPSPGFLFASSTSKPVPPSLTSSTTSFSVLRRVTVLWVVPLYFTALLQAFLSDSEKTQRDVFRQMPWDTFVFEVHADLVLFGEFIAKASDSGRNAQVIKL